MQGKRMTIFIGDHDSWHQRPLYLAILARLRREGFLGATVTRGMAGYSGHGLLKTTEIEVVSELPIVITVIDTRERIEGIVPAITAMMVGGVLAIDDVDVRFFAGLFKSGFPDRLVCDVMSPDPDVTTPEAPLAAVVQHLLECDYTALPVVDDDRRVIGVIDEAVLLDKGLTEMSLSLHKVVGAPLVAEYLKRLGAQGLTVRSAMTETPTVQADRPLKDAAHVMHERGLKRLPVVDDGGRLVGVLGRLDILGSLAAGHAHPFTRKMSPGLPLEHRTVGDIMERDVPTVGEETGLLEILERLVASSVKRVVVVDAQRRPVGIITDTDLVSRLDPDERPGLLTILRSRWNEGARQKVEHRRGHRARELMSPAITVRDTAPVTEALTLTVTRHVKRIPVVDAAGRLVGIASRPALLAASLDLAAG